jgi:hypothetical protein
MQAERDRERRDDGHRHGHREQAERVAHALPERRIGEHLDVETRADELARAARHRAIERAEDGLDERDQEYAGEVQCGGQDEQEAGPPLAPYIGRRPHPSL